MTVLMSAETATPREKENAELLADTFNRWIIRKYDESPNKPWFVIDSSTSELECNYPGAVYGMYDSYAEARAAWFEAIWRTFQRDFMAAYQKRRAAEMLEATLRADAELRAEGKL